MPRECVLNRVQLSATPWTVARQAPQSMGFSGKNAGVGCVSSSRASSRPRGRTHVSCTGRRILYHWATWEPTFKDTRNQITIFSSEWLSSLAFSKQSCTRLHSSTHHNRWILWIQIAHLHLTTWRQGSVAQQTHNQYVMTRSLTPLAVLMGFALSLGTKTFRCWGGTAAMMSTRRGCAESPYLAAVLVFTLKVEHPAWSRSQDSKDKLPEE